MRKRGPIERAGLTGLIVGFIYGGFVCGLIVWLSVECR